MKRYVVGIGEALWDMLPDGGRNIGGAPANFAYHAGRFGLDAIAVSAIGSDALGDGILSALEDRKLGHLFYRVPYPTGTVKVTLDRHGIPSYDITEDVAWDNIPFTPELGEIARGCRAVCFGSLAQRGPVSRETIRKFIRATPKDCMRVFDINLRQRYYSREVVEESLSLCNVLKVNDEELLLVGSMLGYTDGPSLSEGKYLPDGEALGVCQSLIRDYALDTLILTCGVNGSHILTPDGAESFLATPKVEAVDTVGAGDSFTGSFCAARLLGLPVPEAHRIAVEVSAFVCTRHGAMPDLPASLTHIG